MPHPVLVVTLNTKELERKILDQELIAIGRDMDNDIVINNLAVSRFHAIVQVKDSKVFVKDMANDEQDMGIVKSINELSHLFGKKTIAEYVEDEVTIEKLKEIGVDYAQGYHLGKPVPIDMMALLSDSMGD